MTEVEKSKGKGKVYYSSKLKNKLNIDASQW